MNFSDELNNYMLILNCTAKDICDISGLSPALISRYLNKKRAPKINSIYLEKIIDALYQISEKNNINLSKETISEALKDTLKPNNINYDAFIENFNTLQCELKISTVELSKALGYDSSFLSRIKSGERRPADFDNFIDNYADFIMSLSQDEDTGIILQKLLSCTNTDLNDTLKFKDLFIKWITSTHVDNSEHIINFIAMLNDFNLNDYINTDFNKIKIPSTPVIFKNSKTFFGVEGRKKAEGEFLKTTLLSKCKNPIFLYSNLPMTEAGKDENFRKKVVLATTMILKKGLHLNMIHTVDRPLNEMLMGLEGWIPIYMTGAITSYYFKDPPSNFFLNSYWVSDSVALFSECLKTNEETSMFYVTTKKDEVEYGKKISKFLLSKAKPLMKIFKETDAEDFGNFMSENQCENLIKIQKEEFKNIDFCINKGKWVMINKKNSPEIHFVVYNEKLREALYSFLVKKE